jgi:hypothetical protein
VDAVLEAADEEKETAAGTGPSADAKSTEAAETFSRSELRAFFQRNGETIATQAGALRAAQPELAARLDDARSRIAEFLILLDSTGPVDLEDLERKLTVTEEKLTAVLTASAPEGFMVDVRRELDRQLAPYRRKMNAAQLSQLERQYLQKRLWERYNLPRLSLFYMS